MTGSKTLQAMIAGGMALAALVVNEASAAPSTCNAGNTFVLTAASSFGGTFDATGSAVTPDGGTGAFTCVQQQDKFFSAFNLSGLPAGSHAVLSFANIDGTDTHSITYSAGYPLGGSPYTFGYNIEVNPTADPLPRLIQSVSDLVESAGQASLAETLKSNLGATYNIGFTKAGVIYTGNTGAIFASGTQWLDVTDVLTLASTGSNVSGVENSFIEDIPEPVSLLLLVSGMIGLGTVRWMRNAA
jgi:hypothetical protein